jgi:DivIVA domain-containing protein
MSSTELDLPLLPSADQIRRREFATIRRGYDPDQVREYLLLIGAQVEALEIELREARLEAGSPQVVTVPETLEDPYQRLATRMTDVLRSADEQAERILQDAREEAAMTLVEARSEADRIRVDAQARAEEARQAGSEVLKHAEEEAERVLSTLSARRETLVDQLQTMQSRLIGVAQELETAITVPDESEDILDEFADDELEGEEDALATAIAEPLLEDEEGDDAGKGTAEALDLDEADLMDPSYEDLWVSSDTIALDLGDITLGIEDEQTEEAEEE